MTLDMLVRRSIQAATLVVADICALVFSYYAALWLRFDGAIPIKFLDRNSSGVVAAVGVYLLVFVFMRLYRYDWRFASMDTLFSVVVGNTLGAGAAGVMLWMMDMVVLPRSVTIIIWLCSMLLVGATRLSLRMVHGWFTRFAQRQAVPTRRPTNCLIVGTGEEAVHAVRLLRNRALWNYRILGFVDHRQPPATGYYIFGTRILGGLDNLSEVVQQSEADEVIFAIPRADGAFLRKIALECRSLGITPRVIPPLNVSLQQPALDVLPEVSVEDLLRRDPVSIDLGTVEESLRDRVVLVTGAGGSIGSELCRQIMQYRPRKLILLGHGENSIYRIAGELIGKYPEFADRLPQVICDIRDAAQMEQLFAQERPEIVFHAAAHKHVPLMELNPCEAVKNNVGGTQTVARLAGQYGAERFLLISTDKAVNPTSVMGATKWVCEEVVRHLACRYPETRFVTTRFGNVLGSRGSVVPIFKEQIAAGGPVTVTHPQMTRFFMTIPEAAQLVLVASAVGASGQVLVLDMGEPVAILDLAREMIRLAGMEVDRDVKIVFTGLRPGEKLYEELFGAREERLTTPHQGLFLAKRPLYLTPERVQAFVSELLVTAEHWDQDLVCDVLASEMPTLKPMAEGVAG